MKKIVKQILNAPIYADERIIAGLKTFFNGAKEVDKYSIKVDESKKILVDIELKEFDRFLAKTFFLNFISDVGYGYFRMCIREMAEEEIIYSYITAEDERHIIEMELHIR